MHFRHLPAAVRDRLERRGIDAERSCEAFLASIREGSPAGRRSASAIAHALPAVIDGNRVRARGAAEIVRNARTRWRA